MIITGVIRQKAFRINKIKGIELWQSIKREDNFSETNY